MLSQTRLRLRTYAPRDTVSNTFYNICADQAGANALVCMRTSFQVGEPVPQAGALRLAPRLPRPSLRSTDATSDLICAPRLVRTRVACTSQGRRLQWPSTHALRPRTACIRHTCAVPRQRAYPRLQELFLEPPASRYLATKQLYKVLGAPPSPGGARIIRTSYLSD